ncbi:MAG: rhodanese-related sulfurtransferase [Flavobacteriales bacterium]|jgi:rhodanese-related sulfurtransferase
MKNITTLYTLLLATICMAQNSIDKELVRLNNKTVPYISIQELEAKQGIVVLDAREQKEFDVSHIRNAINVGFNKFDKSKITKRVNDKNTPIVVYCSIGVRSEKIGEKLLKLGYKMSIIYMVGFLSTKTKMEKLLITKIKLQIVYTLTIKDGVNT